MKNHYDISIVIPTAGRASLADTLASVKDQLGDGDEIIVVADPGVESVSGIVSQSGVDARVLYDQTAGSREWGYKARTFGMQRANGAWIHIIGDDDVYLPGALNRMREYCSEVTPVMFRMRRRAEFNDVLWAQRELRCGNVAGEMLFFPNKPDKFGTFSNHYEGDWDFVSELIVNYGGHLRWSTEVICVWRAALEQDSAHHPSDELGSTPQLKSEIQKTPLVLSGSVVANAPVTRSDPEIRLCDYRAALFMWITESPFSTIVFADASADIGVCTPEHFMLAEARGKSLVSRAYDLAEVSRCFGKGRAEAILLRRVLEEFKWEEFTKATGRLFVCNSSKLMAERGGVKFSSSVRNDAVDTRFYRLDARVFRDVLVPLETLIDDSDESTYVESVWGRAVRALPELSWWSEPPKIVGVGAT